MEEEVIPEAKFFLKDELIYFLKNHMEIVSVPAASQHFGSTQVTDVSTVIYIAGEEICSTVTRIIHPSNPILEGQVMHLQRDNSRQDDELRIIKKDLSDAVHHLLTLKKRIDGYNIP